MTSSRTTNTDQATEALEALLLDVLSRVKSGKLPNARQLESIIRAHSKRESAAGLRLAKRMLLPYYLRVKQHEPAHWRSWDISDDEESTLIALLQMKPRRTASGVATITVLTKPWKCGGSCLYCPNDLRMPKSYLSDEPACQRAERNCFDPYLQVISRLQALVQMGHHTDKIELIILGGTWSDYPKDYQLWFVRELFRALNDAGTELDAPALQERERRRAWYREQGISSEADDARAFVAAAQAQVNAGTLSYNQAVTLLYKENEPWKRVAQAQRASIDELREQHRINETAHHRVVGLVVETRPDAVDPESLRVARELGCTKLQMGIQSLNADILRTNSRLASPETVARTLAQARLFGFKLHVHFMVNLLGATPAQDIRDFRTLVENPAYLPDEVKLYPCALVEGTGLTTSYAQKAWQPYSEDELLEVLVADLCAAPDYLRISRMVRDISAKDILAGNKKANLRQLVEERALYKAAAENKPLREIRVRELNRTQPALSDLRLDDVVYESSVSCEHFLQWVTPDYHIAGFLRLSLPLTQAADALGVQRPFPAEEAMIREVHVYGTAAHIGGEGENAQHLGLGRALVARACDIAREAGFTRINVISAVGTREYYRKLGFADVGLYQQKDL